jgi:hypothetical protein
MTFVKHWLLLILLGISFKIIVLRNFCKNTAIKIFQKIRRYENTTWMAVTI